MKERTASREFHLLDVPGRQLFLEEAVLGPFAPLLAPAVQQSGPLLPPSLIMGLQRHEIMFFPFLSIFLVGFASLLEKGLEHTQKFSLSSSRSFQFSHFLAGNPDQLTQEFATFGRQVH